MDKKVIIGGMVGAAVIFVFSFGMLLLLSQWLTNLATSTTNLLVSLIIFLLAPVGGGFLAGMIGKPNPRRAGLVAGANAGVLVLIGFLMVFGFSLQTLLIGLVVVFVWVVLARISAGFYRKG